MQARSEPEASGGDYIDPAMRPALVAIGRVAKGASARWPEGCGSLCVSQQGLPMLTKSEKAEVVGGLTDRFRRQRVSIFADFRGISVAKLTAFRGELRAIGAEFKVAKKTLLKRALEAAGPEFGGIEPKDLEGEIGVIFGYEDQVAPAKAAAKFSKENETFKVLKGMLAGKIIEAKAIIALAKLPP